MPCGRAEFCAMWFPIPLTILQLQEKITSYFITKLNLTFPRTQTEPNTGSPITRTELNLVFTNLTRTRTEPNPNNEGSFLSLQYIKLSVPIIDAETKACLQGAIKSYQTACGLCGLFLEYNDNVCHTSLC